MGLGLTISSLVLMPALDLAKRRLGARLGSGATAGEGTQNLLCAYPAAAVLAGLLAKLFCAWWWLDAVAGGPRARWAGAARSGRWRPRPG
jgi:divalent metal cation (Fe/Co/Zn/Cd) transporter